MAERVPPASPPPGPHSSSLLSPSSRTVSFTTIVQQDPKADPNPNPNSYPNPAIAAAAAATETYIVQVPKDQIYRVPPPENAYLVEHYRKQLSSRRRRRCPCFSFLKWLLIAALVLAVTFAISAIAFFAVVHPGAPKFTVDRVFVENPKKPAYDVAMHAANPSARMGIVYEGGGKATLSHRGVNVAGGTTPGFQQGAQNTTRFRLVLSGSHAAPPKEIERGLKGSKEVVSLTLTVEFKVRAKISGIEIGGMSVGVTCDVKVHGLVKDVRIASQACKTNFRT
ncbi:NDR1/HIN1-like protein 13 [Ananas comosus]|uniref:NDR1/HIN1-like protein 13 n=1 Tax=Ananas comosus TaxID=4615 RepID=A0A6P5G8Z3_ANACO|nr:NDR1/HIN1-like protein 13 [Ananas comosus]